MCRCIATDRNNQRARQPRATGYCLNHRTPPADVPVNRSKLPAPRSGFAAAYRMSTRVKRFAYRTKTYPTFTLPRYVDLG